MLHFTEQELERQRHSNVEHELDIVLEENSILEDRVKELEAKIDNMKYGTDRYCTGLTPAEREVIEASREAYQCVDILSLRLCDAVAALEKERGK